MLQHEFSEDQVFKRMQKVAAEVWNIRDSEMSSIDPLVQLMMKGLAKEVEKVGNELQNSEARILKRIARQLMPDQMQTAVPAHAVLHFQPSETVEISRYDHFTLDKRWQNKAKFNRIETRTLNFTPAGTFLTNTGKIAYRIESGQIFGVTPLNKTRIDNIDFSQADDEIIIGIKNLTPGTVHFYFDWLTEKSKKVLYNALSKVKITLLNGKAVPTHWGLKPTEKKHNYFEEKFNSLLKMEQTVLGFYQNQFVNITLSKQDIEDARSAADATLSDILNDFDDIEKESITWLRLTFPPEIDEKRVHEITAQMNCYPVLNRKMCRQVFRLQPELNIRKFEFEGHFLGVERVETSRGEFYSEQDSLRLDENLKGTYTVRMGSVGRIDERDGHGYLKYLLDLIREEKQAFSSANVSSTLADLDTISQTIEKIEKRISSDGASGSEPYIMLTPIKSFENIYVHFWSTDGAFANAINPNQELECKTTGLSDSGQAIFVKSTIGGADGLMDAELIRNYKNAILSKESVVTVADIRSLGFSIGGRAIASIDVRKEIAEAGQRKTGLIQQLSIYLKFKDALDDEALKDYIVQRFEAEIEAKSNFSIPHQIFVLNG